MARKKANNSDSMLPWFALIAAVLAVPIMIIATIRYFRLKKKYLTDNNSYRVFDIGRLAVHFVSLIPIATMIAYGSSVTLSNFRATPEAPFSAVGIGLVYTITAITILLVIWVYSRMLSLDLLGSLVLPNQGIAVLPRRFADFTLEDYFSLRFLFKLGEVSELPLSEVRTLTRDAGKALYVHGDFGSRSALFTNKQKRDEFLSHLSSHSPARVSR